MKTYAIIALVSFAAGWTVNEWRLQGEIDQLHATWNEAYANQAQATLEKERELNQLNVTVETLHHETQQQIDAVYRHNHELVAQLGGMRDPGKRERPLPKSNGACQCQCPACDSGLSGEASQFLLELARDADRVAAYANSCHQWALGVEQSTNP